MTQDFNRRNIANLLETIVEQFQGINQYKGKIPRIEVDLMLSNIRNLYETVIEFDKSASKMEERSSISSAKTRENISQESSEAENIGSSLAFELNESVEMADNEKNIDFSIFEKEEAIVEVELDDVILAEEEEEEEEIQIEEEEEEIMDQFSQSEYTEEEIKEEIEGEIIVEEETQIEQIETYKTEKNSLGVIPGLFDDFQAEAASKNETIGSAETPTYTTPSKTGNSSNSIIEKAHRKPIDDLRTAIGINEKYAFINELFKGNAEAYTHFLEGVNSSHSKEKAEEIINLSENQYSWNKESKPYNTLIELIERRFSN